MPGLYLFMGLYFFSKVVAQSVCILYITCSGGGIDVQVNLYLDDGDMSLIKADSLVKGI